MKKLKSSLLAEVVPKGAFTEISFISDKGFGEIIENKLWLFSEEAMFLTEKGFLDLGMTEKKARKYFSKHNKNFLHRYFVYRDLRIKGYVVKSGAKYGADFRVYEKGVKPSHKEKREHSKYLVWVKGQDEKFEIKTLLGINRVSHSVKKRLIISIVDKELDVTYIQNARVLL